MAILRPVSDRLNVSCPRDRAGWAAPALRTTSKIAGRLLGVALLLAFAQACAGDAKSSSPATASVQPRPPVAGAAGVQPAAAAGASGSPSTSPSGGMGGQAGAGAPAAAGRAAEGAGMHAGSAGSASPSAGIGASGSDAGAGSGAADSGMGTSCAALDPLRILQELAPADADLAGDYADYLSDELGSVTCATEGTGSARTIMQPIFVPPGMEYDGRGETLTADVASMRCDTSEGEQAESQRPYFVLAPGARVKNVTITYPGCEGIHMMGDNVLDHITWQDAGEDAASVRSYFPGGKIAITNSEGHKAADKMFQFNAPCDVRIERFTGSDMGKLVRQNGGSEFELKIDLNTVHVTGVISAVVQSDSPLCFVRHHGLSYEFTGSGDKADRVFRDVPPGNVSEY